MSTYFDLIYHPQDYNSPQVYSPTLLPYPLWSPPLSKQLFFNIGLHWSVLDLPRTTCTLRIYHAPCLRLKFHGQLPTLCWDLVTWIYSSHSCCHNHYKSAWSEDDLLCLGVSLSSTYSTFKGASMPTVESFWVVFRKLNSF